MEFMQSLHRPSNSEGLDQYCGKFLKMVCFRSCNSAIGSPGNSRPATGVHLLIMSSPKIASLASFIAKVGAFDSPLSLLYLAKTSSTELSAV